MRRRRLLACRARLGLETSARCTASWQTPSIKRMQRPNNKQNQPNKEKDDERQPGKTANGQGEAGISSIGTAGMSQLWRRGERILGRSRGQLSHPINNGCLALQGHGPTCAEVHVAGTMEDRCQCLLKRGDKETMRRGQLNG